MISGFQYRKSSKSGEVTSSTPLPTPPTLPEVDERRKTSSAPVETASTPPPRDDDVDVAAADFRVGEIDEEVEEEDEDERCAGLGGSEGLTLEDRLPADGG